VLEELLGRDTKFRDEAQHDLIKRCMKSNGFDYSAPRVFSEPTVVAPRASLEYREVHGYGIAPELRTNQEPQVLDPTDDDFNVMSEREQRAFNAQEQRCWDDAQQELNARVQSNVDNLPDGLLDHIIAAELAVAIELRENVDDWSRCMNERGHPYADSVALWQDLEQRFSEVRSDTEAVERFRAQEIAVAVDDFHCFEEHVAVAQDALLDDLKAQLNGSLEADSIYS